MDIEIEVQDIDHLGLIAGIIDDIGIVEIIDQELGTHEQEKVSAGLVVKAMIINCMGFLTAPLWILQCFQSVHLVFINGIKSSIKLTDRQKLILQFFGASSHQYYFLS